MRYPCIPPTPAPHLATAFESSAMPLDAMPLDIVRVPVLSDNYAWLIHDPDSGTTVAP